ncbi:GspE/PulE family protein [Desulfatitalea alkaliphila]|uniref:GspE/PulE family protein n=1 Tax=Desulfatitalea alkaliphila TaxID=2929485 RepID=A0AA41R2Y8_9BACT|nr:GspE/PulE family protein [Desulfatitalea alkaliphila]MCJ8501934.1 GspE/PulE family protein [Desulfatitalea alkaliphila]
MAGNPFQAEEVCRILVRNKVLAVSSAQEILRKQHGLVQKLERIREKKYAQVPASEAISNPVTIVDVIASLKLSRLDNPGLPLDEETVFKYLAGHWQMPFFRLDPLKLDLNVVTSTIPRTFAMKHLVVPVAVEDGVLTVAMPNPFDEEVLHDITMASKMRVEAVVSPKSDIIKLINEFFGFKRSIVAAQDQFGGIGVDLGNLEQYVRLRSADELPANDQHIVNAVDHLFIYAFDQKASDIHIEPKRELTLVRMRIDGVLHTVYKLPRAVHSAIVSRIKNLARMDMAEKRRPQDGRIKTDKGDVEVEIRVSTVPVAFGEKMVMRIMDPDILFRDLAQLGFSPLDLERYQNVISMPHGILLVCGPTGSGKSTTLYSTLKRIDSPGINITTVEEPIEMVHESFNQIAVQTQIGVTFGSVLRNILRQDPDVIMIGEMRDLETAENATQAALTGHLVLSTLHTNDAPSAIMRLLDLGLPHFLIQATLVGVLSQRLVRKICNYCKVSYEISGDELRTAGLDVGRDGSLTLARGRGCEKCRGTGYLGRTCVVEMMPFTESLRRMTTEGADVALIRAKAREEGMRTLRESAIEKLLEGITTHEEVLRVTWEH